MLRNLLIALCTLTASAQTVRIGVFTLFHPTQLEIRSAPSTAILLTSGATQLILNGEPGSTKALVRLANSRLLLGEDPTQSIVVTARDGGATDFVLSVPGRITRHYHGVLHISANEKQLIPTVSMNIETATASVVAAESPPGARIEALKAQAVVARSFFYAGSRHQLYDFCDTTHCQFLREPPPAGSPAAIAARETAGLILTWHGAPLAAMYSSRCGGRTTSLRDIGIASSGYPYFAVSRAYCLRHPVKWKRSLSPADAKKLAKSEEIQRLALDRQHGWSAIPSNRYTSIKSSNGVVLIGEGAGHGLGLCQYGSAGMAAEGAGFAAILRHYYPETELAPIPESLNTKP